MQRSTATHIVVVDLHFIQLPVGGLVNENYTLLGALLQFAAHFLQKSTEIRKDRTFLEFDVLLFRLSYPLNHVLGIV